jgi:hypothetical protein
MKPEKQITGCLPSPEKKLADNEFISVANVINKNENQEKQMVTLVTFHLQKNLAWVRIPTKGVVHSTIHKL